MNIKMRILALLLDEQPHSRTELAQEQARFGATIQSLRKDGWEVETIAPGVYKEWMYLLHGRKEGYKAQRHACPSCTCFQLEV